MKKIFLFAAILSSYSATATIHNVNNNVNSPGSFTNLQTAIDNAVQGDTIYVAGSATSYGAITLNKSLKIFGAGINNPNGLNTTVGTIAMGRTNVTTGANGSKLSGLICGSITITGSFSGGTIATNLMTDITIERCSSTGITINTGSNPIDYSNFLIRNCYLAAGSGNNIYFAGSSVNSIYNNFRIENNVIDNGIIFRVQNTSVDVNVVTFSNNVCINKTTASSFFFPVSYPYPGPTFNNNIFYGVWPEGCINCTFSNNLTYFCNEDELIDAANPGSIGSGNIIGQNPNFVNYPALGGPFNFSHDYNLQTSSPGKNAGTDGTDLGIYGGASPMAIGVNPAIPQMQNVTFPLGGSVGVGTNLNVNFNSYKQD
jgi:hypothetical protein